jgi:hypothetical protein
MEKYRMFVLLFLFYGGKIAAATGMFLFKRF